MQKLQGKDQVDSKITYSSFHLKNRAKISWFLLRGKILERWLLKVLGHTGLPDVALTFFLLLCPYTLTLLLVLAECKAQIRLVLQLRWLKLAEGSKCPRLPITCHILSHQRASLFEQKLLVLSWHPAGVPESQNCKGCKEPLQIIGFQPLCWSAGTN